MIFNRLVRGSLMNPVSAIVGGVGSMVGGILGANAANDAAKIQQQNAEKVADMAQKASDTAVSGINTATGQATGTLKDVYATEAANLNPYLATGTTGLQMLNSAVAPGGSLAQTFSFNPQDIYNDQGYQFQLQQGQKALQQAAAARGQVLGGGTLKALDQYTQGLASTEYGQAYNRALTAFQTNRANTMQNLSTMLGVGQFGTSSLNNAAQNFGNVSAGTTMQGATTAGNFGMEGAQIAGSALTGGANAAAAGKVGAASAWNSALGGVTNAANTYSLAQMLQPAAPTPASFSLPAPSAYAAAPAVTPSFAGMTPSLADMMPVASAGL